MRRSLSARRLAAGLTLALLALLLLTALLLLMARAICLSYKQATPLPPPAARQEAQLAAQLQHDVEQLCAHPRYGSAADRKRAANYLAQRLQTAGWQVHWQRLILPCDPEMDEGAPAAPPATSSGTPPEGWEEHWNLIATPPGTPPTGASGCGRRYIIGAHYDACDTGNGNPGADDNASACAALLSLADMLSPLKAPPHPGTPTLELVFYASEEPPWFNTPWMGSARHAQLCDPANTLGMVCLEMLGYYNNAPCAYPELLPGHSLLLPEKGDFIAIVGDTAAISLARHAQPYLTRGMPSLRANIPFAHSTELFFSDHRNYIARGIPAVMVTDTALLRNPHYHEPTDTPDTLDYPRLARITLNLARFLRTLTQL